MIPLQDTIDISKLNNGGCINTDTCNTAQKTCRILVEVVNDTGGIVLEQDHCYHHLRCDHINGMTKSVNGYMGEVIEESLKNIHPQLWVTPNLDHLIRAYHKEFSLTANNPKPKGHGELFRD